MKPGYAGLFCYLDNKYICYMAKVIEINKTTSRSQLDAALIKLPKKKAAIDLNKYFGKVQFGVDGLEYQLKTRDEWR